MTWTLNIDQLEALEPRLEALVKSEGQIVLTHNGEPVAILVPVAEKQQPGDQRATQVPSR